MRERFHLSCVAGRNTPRSADRWGNLHRPRARSERVSTIKITNNSGVVTNVITNEGGFYSAPNLLPGTYDVTVTFDGFNSQTRKGLSLTVGGEAAVDFEMKVGNVNENVVVSGDAPRIETASATLRHNVSGTTIRELPLNGRDWTQLAMLQPGVVGVGNSGGTRSGNGMKMAVAEQLSPERHRCERLRQYDARKRPRHESRRRSGGRVLGAD